MTRTINILIIDMLLSILILTGCTKQQKVNDIDMLWSDGKCLFHSKGMAIEQAEQINKSWKFKDCDVMINAEDEGKKK